MVMCSCIDKSYIFWIMNGLIERIGIDKLCHFGIGGVVTAFVAVVAMFQEMPFESMWFSLVFPLMGTVVTLILGFLKEFVVDEKA